MGSFLKRGKMEKKLYRVKVVLYIMAENEAEACAAATQAPFDIFECVARKAENVDPEWQDAIPYNADDEHTCGEIMASKQQPPSQEIQPVKLPGYVVTAMRVFDKENRSIRQGG
jgi:hypothetical protein